MHDDNMIIFFMNISKHNPLIRKLASLRGIGQFQEMKCKGKQKNLMGSFVETFS